LADDAEVTYMTGADYAPTHEGGLGFADPRLDIAWPLPPTIVSPKDQSWPPFPEIEAAVRARMSVARDRTDA
jgi:dTDP-4-dehydrorhamnose 3,5-epimerase